MPVRSFPLKHKAEEARQPGELVWAEELPRQPNGKKGARRFYVGALAELKAAFMDLPEADRVRRRPAARR